jgi:hypothetical protein
LRKIEGKDQYFQSEIKMAVFGEEPLDEVEPGAGRRREVQDEAFASYQPAIQENGSRA